MFEITNSANVRCHAGSPRSGLSRRWLGRERLHLRFTQPISTAMHFVLAGVQPPNPALVPAQQGNSRGTTRSTSPVAIIRGAWGSMWARGPRQAWYRSMGQYQMTRALVVLSLTVFAAGCTTLSNKGPHTGEAEQEQVNGHDPWEGFNRTIYRFNDEVDRLVIKPLAKGYRRVTPRPVRRSVGNFFRNLLEPTTIVNDLLQGKPLQAISDSGRFLLNSTLGIVGLFDVAAKVGVERNQEDFGQTFAVWGVPSGPYVVLPFLGPSNVRDAFGLLPYYYFTDPRLALDDRQARVALVAIDVIDFRSQLLGATRLLDMQLDPYLFSRESYRQKRLDLIYDGEPPLDEPTL